MKQTTLGLPQVWVKKTILPMAILSFALLATSCESNVKENQSTIDSEDLIYFVVTDRFADGDTANNTAPDYDPKNPKAFHGGDFAGLTQKLDYIESLGTTAIWITPIVKNQPWGYHGYWATDFETTDPHLGTLEDFKAFVEAAHKRDMKVILDYVVNHTGYESPWLKDPEKKDWFHPKKDIANWSDLKEVENNWLFGLPDLNTENPEVLDYFIQNANQWIDQTGIDGMRLDTVRHVPRPFWNAFVKGIKEKHPEFFLLGEVWSDNVRYMQLYNDEGIDGMTNYSLYQGIINTFKASGSSSSLYNAFEKESFFKTPKQNGIFIDNHDNARLITAAGKSYARQALAFVMTYPAVPILYYGTEIGMEGKGDPDNRRFMAWDTVEGNDQLAFYNQLLAIRKDYDATRQGTVSALKTGNDLVGYTVMDQNRGLALFMNLRKTAIDVTIPLEDNQQKLKLKGKPILATGVEATKGIVVKEGNSLRATLQPGQILIYDCSQ